MQTSPDEVVLNQVTSTDLKAPINFGRAKTNSFINIYNFRVSFPNNIIYLALTNITTCFCFLRISADVAGAFGFIAESKYCVSTSHVFGSNTLASSWVAFRRAIQNMITVLAQQDDLTKKHEDLLNVLCWTDENARPEFV